MANFLRASYPFSTERVKSFSSNKTKITLLELGSGCGLAGIAALRYCSHKIENFILTDGNFQVLKRLRTNLNLNNRQETNNCKIFTEFLNWADYDLKQLPSLPNIIIGSGKFLFFY